MELGLSLGTTREMPCTVEKPSRTSWMNLDLGFGMELGGGALVGEKEKVDKGREDPQEGVAADMPLELNLLPLSPVSRHSSSQLVFSWVAETRNLESSTLGFDVTRVPKAVKGAALPVTGGGESRGEAERVWSRASDEEENALSARKKLRLSKEQSDFLEESFREQNALNPQQKLALAKQLNLRPRQVEVWFQNRRARTKLKQTEVDCQHLKRCCETLTEENRRLQRELADLRALKAAQPLYMQLPATTLSMCPSCERVSSATDNNATVITGSEHKKPASLAALLAKSRRFPFANHPDPARLPSVAS